MRFIAVILRLIARRVGVAALLVVFLVGVAGFQHALFATNIELSPDRRTGARFDRYTLKYGTLQLGLTGEFAVRWSDNNDYSPEDDDDDADGWSMVPALSLDIYWPVSPYIEVNTDIRFAYHHYFGGAGENDWEISGDEGQVSSDFGIDFKLGQDGLLTLYDEISREIESLRVAREARDADYSLLTNVLGLRYENQLNRDWNASIQYEHKNRWASPGEYDYEDSISDAIDVVFLRRVTPTLKLGPYVRYERIRFPEDRRNDRDVWGGGLSYVWDSRSWVSIDGVVGYEVTEVDTDNDSTATDQGGEWVTRFNVSVNPAVLPGHRVRASYRREHEDVSEGHNYSDEILLGYGILFRYGDYTRVFADVDWMDINESDDGEHAQLWRFRLGTGYDLTRDTDLDATYEYTDKSSDIDGNDYTRNVFEVKVKHRF
jgi:opacity protein-like surface antigen